MKGSEIANPGHLIGLKRRRFPNWGARQQPIKICPLCLVMVGYLMLSYANPWSNESSISPSAAQHSCSVNYCIRLTTCCAKLGVARCCSVLLGAARCCSV